MGWILGFGIPLTYLFGVAVSFRVLYVRSMKAYIRWKNEAPKKQARISYSGPYYDRRLRQTRSEFTYEAYLDSVDNDSSLRPAHAWLWPGLITIFPLAIGVAGFCTPKVKVPDQIKIKKLELEDL